MRIGAVLLSALACTLGSSAAEKAPLPLLATIPLPNVTGRFDHSAVDLEGQRLFVTARDGDTVEVVDLREGRVVHSLGGFAQPQGAFYVPSAKKLFVSSARDGTLKIIDGRSLEVVNTIQLSTGANVIAYDPRANHLYIGHGGRQAGDPPTAKRDAGQIAIVDAAKGTQIGNIRTNAELRPGAIVLESGGPRLFTTNAFGSEVVVIDRKKGVVLATWPIPSAERSGTVALDEARRRLFVGTRKPGLVIVLDMDSGRQVTSFPTVDGIDRLLYDAANKRLYATGSPKIPKNVGAIEAYRQVDADHYERLATIPTGQDGGTSLLVPATNRLYVTLPRDGERNAEIRVYDTEP